MSASIKDVLTRAKIIPVITIEDAKLAADLARALIAGGLTTVEITLRTSQGLKAIAEIARKVPECLLGVGTVLSVEDMQRASDAGAVFAVSPGGTDRLYEAADRLKMPFLPGVQSASEIMRGMEWGYEVFKFYPAEQSGGPAFLRNIALPFPDVRFCTTGGLNQVNAAMYFKLPNVIAVGGFWMATKELINTSDWAAITRLSRSALEALN